MRCSTCHHVTRYISLSTLPPPSTHPHRRSPIPPRCAQPTSRKLGKDCWGKGKFLFPQPHTGPRLTWLVGWYRPRHHFYLPSSSRPLAEDDQNEQRKSETPTQHKWGWTAQRRPGVKQHNRMSVHEAEWPSVSWKHQTWVRNTQCGFEQPTVTMGLELNDSMWSCMRLDV